jgi:hypothetical protein
VSFLAGGKTEDAPVETYYHKTKYLVRDEPPQKGNQGPDIGQIDGLASTAIRLLPLLAGAKNSQYIDRKQD